ncbi:MAG: tRNA glutamyl-Q(34) synthetase GluQRS [Gammaproteobacteria bacterium]
MHEPEKTTRKQRGRFAPSPTGQLHFGSLIAAVGSFLDARHHGEEWLVRIEDIDPPREVAHAADDILRSLEAFGMAWDGPVVYQSKRGNVYAAALNTLTLQHRVYGCACTRKEIADSAMQADSGAIYPGTCRKGLPKGRKARALRVKVEPREICLEDRLQGTFRQQLDRDAGDFIIRRADQLIAYQLAVVADDDEQGISRVVRGADLLESTPRQIYLQHLLGFHTPTYLHLPVATGLNGDKLSKQTRAQPVTADDRNRTIVDVLRFLNQTVPDSPDDATRDELWEWAIDHWNASLIPAQRSMPAPARYISP